MLGIETFYVKENQYPGDICDFDKYIITGSLESAYTNSGWILGLKQFCREAAVCGAKLIGICFGHQLLAEAFGGKVEPAKAGWGGQAGFKAHGGQLSCKVFPQGRVCTRIQPPRPSCLPAARLKNTIFVFFLPHREFVNREFRADISGASRIRRHLRWHAFQIFLQPVFTEGEKPKGKQCFAFARQRRSGEGNFRFLAASPAPRGLVLRIFCQPFNTAADPSAFAPCKRCTKLSGSRRGRHITGGGEMRLSCFGLSEVSNCAPLPIFNMDLLIKTTPAAVAIYLCAVCFSYSEQEASA